MSKQQKNKNKSLSSFFNFKKSPIDTPMTMNMTKNIYLDKFKFYNKIKNKDLLEINYFKNLFKIIENDIKLNLKINSEKIYKLFNSILKKYIFENSDLLWNDKYKPYLKEDILEENFYNEIKEYLKKDKKYSLKGKNYKFNINDYYFDDYNNNILVINSEQGFGAHKSLITILKIFEYQIEDIDFIKYSKFNQLKKHITKTIENINVQFFNDNNIKINKKVYIFKHIEFLEEYYDENFYIYFRDFLDFLSKNKFIFIFIHDKSKNYVFKNNIKIIKYKNIDINYRLCYFKMIFFIELNLNLKNNKIYEKMIINNYEEIWDNNWDYLNNIKENFNFKKINFEFLKQFCFSLDNNIMSILSKSQFNLNSFLVKNNEFERNQIIISQFMVNNICKSNFLNKNIKYKNYEIKFWNLKKNYNENFNDNLLIKKYNKTEYFYFLKSKDKINNFKFSLDFKNKEIKIKFKKIFNNSIKLNLRMNTTLIPNKLFFYIYFLKNYNIKKQKITRITQKYDQNENFLYFLFNIKEIKKTILKLELIDN